MSQHTIETLQTEFSPPQRNLAEYSESEASPELNAIFSEIKRLWGIDSPALFFRSLATIPGALSQCWEIIAPFALSGQLYLAAATMAADVEGQMDAGLEPLRKSDIGLVACDIAHIRNALASYNRANPQNLLSAAILAKCGARSSDLSCNVASQGLAWAPPERLVLSTSMLKPESINDYAMAAIERLSPPFPVDGRTTSDQTVIIPSLYRHLALFPSFLQYAADSLDLNNQRILLVELSSRLRTKAFAVQGITLDACRSADRTPFACDVENLIERFLHTIPEMIVMGIYLNRLIAKAEASILA